MTAARTLAAAGLWGALLTVVIVAMSVLLRLGTQLEGAGPVSTLPAGVEQGARIAHRIAAMAVGVLAALALFATWQSRPVPRGRLAAVGAIVSLTLMLAMIGRYTPGYRYDLVTAANVMGGIALAASFWWLRVQGRGDRGSDAVPWTALGLLLALAGLGAVADAAAMRGERAFGPRHLLLGAVLVVLVFAAAWRARRRPALALPAAALVGLQLALGFALLAAQGARPLALAWTHAVLTCVLALLLVTLAER